MKKTEANLVTFAASSPKQSRSRTISTAGYEGCDPMSFVQSLQTNCIETLVDVRQRAASRKRGFAKTALSASANEAGVMYVHIPLLGTPATLREQHRVGDLNLETYLQLYREHLAEQEAIVVELERRIEIERCCLMCVEADPAICHRTVLANYLVERSNGQLSVHNILSKDS